MRCNQKGLDAKDAGRQQNEVLFQVVTLIGFLVLLQLFHQVFKYIVAKYRLENGLDPIPVTCVVRHFSAGNAYYPPSIQAYACGPLFSEVDITRTPTHPSNFRVQLHDLLLFCLCVNFYHTREINVITCSHTTLSPTASDFCDGPVQMEMGKHDSPEAGTMKVCPLLFARVGKPFMLCVIHRSRTLTAARLLSACFRFSPGRVI